MFWDHVLKPREAFESEKSVEQKQFYYSGHSKDVRKKRYAHFANIAIK